MMACWILFSAIFLEFYMILSVVISPILAVLVSLGLMWGTICGIRNAVKAVRKVHGKGGVA
jgi:hypothetical protein